MADSRYTGVLFEATVISGLALGTYAGTISVQMGYHKAYRLPREFVTVAFDEFMAVLLSVLCLCALAIVSIVLFRQMIRTKGLRLRIACLTGLIVLFGVLFGAALKVNDRAGVLSVFGYLAAIYVFGVTGWLVVLKGAVTAQAENNVIDRLNRIVWTGAVGLLCWIALTWCTGYIYGSTRTEFMVVSRDDRLVVLRTFRDRLVTAPINADSTVTESELRVIQMPDDDRTISLERIGPLTVTGRSVFVPR